MLNIIKSQIKSLLNLYPSWVCKEEFQQQKFTRFNERPVEFSFAFRKIAEIYPKRILDVGTGDTALPHLFYNCGAIVTAIDNVQDYWAEGMTNRHFHVLDDDICKTQLKDKYDLITCISVLEHIEKPAKAVRNMFSLLNSGGHLILTFPYNEDKYVRNVFELPNSNYGKGLPYITQAYSRSELEQWLDENHGVIIEQEYWQFWEGENWTIGNQVIPPNKVTAVERHQLTCLHIKKG